MYQIDFEIFIYHMYLRPAISLQKIPKYSKGRTPLECITGETSDIPEYLEFRFYQWVTFISNAISCTTVQRLAELEKYTNEWKQRMENFTDTIELKLGNSVKGEGIPEKDLIGMPREFL